MLLSDSASFAGFHTDTVAVFVFVLWLWLLVMTSIDLFRRRDMSGVGRVIGVILLFCLPNVGTFAYISREGSGVAERKRADNEEMRDALRQSVGYSPGDELQRTSLPTRST